MSELKEVSKNTLINRARLKASLIAGFFIIPFIFIYINLMFLGDQFLIKTASILIAVIAIVVYNSIMCDVKGILDEEVNWKKKKVINNIIYITIFIVCTIFYYFF